jgi:hypothetical protein
MKLLCLFGYHKPGDAVTNFKDGLFVGKLDGIHEMNTNYKCVSCRRFFNIESTLEVRDKFNILKRNELTDGKIEEIKLYLDDEKLSIKEIAEKTQVSETTIRRVKKKY